jgi:hypothetical protein
VRVASGSNNSEFRSNRILRIIDPLTRFAADSLPFSFNAASIRSSLSRRSCMADFDPSVTDYVLEVAARCLQCGAEINEKTLVDLAWPGRLASS